MTTAAVKGKAATVTPYASSLEIAVGRMGQVKTTRAQDLLAHNATAIEA
jgi:hypothetical protein